MVQVWCKERGRLFFPIILFNSKEMPRSRCRSSKGKTKKKSSPRRLSSSSRGKTRARYRAASTHMPSAKARWFYQIMGSEKVLPRFHERALNELLRHIPDTDPENVQTRHLKQLLGHQIYDTCGKRYFIEYGLFDRNLADYLGKLINVWNQWNDRDKRYEDEYKERIERMLPPQQTGEVMLYVHVYREGYTAGGAEMFAARGFQPVRSDETNDDNNEHLQMALQELIRSCPLLQCDDNDAPMDEASGSGKRRRHG